MKKLENWIKSKAVNEIKEGVERLDESFKWATLYKDFYNKSPVEINLEKYFKFTRSY